MTGTTAATARQKASGGALFTSDLAPDDTVVADMARSPHPHANVVGIDVSAALAVPGVLAVLTPVDFEGILLGRQLPDEPVLTSTVRYVGDGVAAVAATDQAALLAGIAALEIAYEPLPHAVTVNEARTMEHDIHTGTPGNVARTFRADRGDWDAAATEAVAWAEATFRNDPVPHAYLEPRATVVRVVGDHLELVTGTHFPTVLQEEYARIAATWGAEVSVVTPDIGGSFGAKWEHPTHLVCLAFAHRLKRHVTMVSPRRDEMLAGRVRLGMRISMAIGADADGRLVAKRTRIEADNGAYSGHGPTVTLSAAIRSDNLYRYDAVSAAAELVYTNTVPSECFRGFGYPQATFAQEQLIDELAGRLGIDPVEMRRKNASRTGDKTIHGWQIGSCGLDLCLDEISERMTAHRLTQEHGCGTGADPLVEGRFRTGYGVAAGIHAISSSAYTTGMDLDNVVLTPMADGSIVVGSGQVELGCGTVDTMRLIVADALGLDLESVRVVLGDGRTGPHGLGSFASRTTFFAGQAALIACAELDARCVVMEEEMGLSNDAGLKEVIAATAEQGRLAELAVTATYAPTTTEAPDGSGYGNISPAYNFAAHGCFVTVDTWTGRTCVERYWAAHDAGRIINPVAAEGQVIGGVHQGLGFALTESLAVGSDGTVLNPGFLDDRVPTSADAVPIEVMFVDTSEPNGPDGSKSIAEPPIIPVAACVANAIYDAVGVRPLHTPMTSERTWRQLRLKDLRAHGAKP